MSLAAKLPYDHPYAGGYPGLSSQALPTDADALDYLSRVKAADGAGVEVGVATAVDAFFRDLKATPGLFDAIKASCILCGARTLAGALVPVVGDAPTNVADAFADGDYSRTNGLTGDAATTYLDTGLAPSGGLLNDAHLAVFITAAAPNPNERYAGATDTQSPATSFMLYDNDVLTGGYINTDTITDVSNKTAVNLIGVTRGDSSEQTAFVDGSHVTESNASNRASDLNIYIFCRNLNGSPNLVTDATIAYYSIGTDIGSAGLSALDTAVSNLITAIGEAL